MGDASPARTAYSDRSAIVGSILVARSAGIKEASSDAANRISGAAVSTSGSMLRMPYSMPCRICPAPSASNRPIAMPTLR